MESRQDKKSNKRIWRALLWLLGFVVLAALALAVIVYLTPLPEVQLPQTSLIYDRDSRPLTSIAEQNRVPVAYDELPENLINAVIAIEDNRFWKHYGLDPWALLRAVYRNMQAGRIVEGGSTITQQLAKNLFLTQEKTFIRKIQEAIYTIKLEQQFSKESILTQYLNIIYLGHGALGVEAASQLYFGKHVSELTLGESAMIAGIIRSPERYTPYKYPDVAQERKEIALSRMQELGYISEDEASEARDEPIELVGLSRRNPSDSYVIDYVRRELKSFFPGIEEDLETGGYRIYTTVDLNAQRSAAAILNNSLGEPRLIDSRGVPQPQGALVAIDPATGGIVALIGGRDDTTSNQLNRSIFGQGRQPGSSFKPFIYAAAIEAGYTPLDQFDCTYIRYPDGEGEWWEPTDYQAKPEDPPYHEQPLTMRQALAVSDNVVTAQWAERVGLTHIIELARRMGIKSQLNRDLTLALGTSEVLVLDLAQAYVPFANLGYAMEPYMITRLEDSQGNILYEGSPKPQQVIAPETAYLITDMLVSAFEYGTATHLQAIVGRPAAGKTGTTQDHRDAWFVGYTPDLVTAVWVGYDQPQRLWAPGGWLAGPIWAELTAQALQDTPPRDFPKPPGIVTAEVCGPHGYPKYGLEPTTGSFTEVFKEGTVPEGTCPEPEVQEPPSFWDIIDRWLRQQPEEEIDPWE